MHYLVARSEDASMEMKMEGFMKKVWNGKVGKCVRCFISGVVG